MSLFLAAALVAMLGLMAAVRLAPSDPETWNIDPVRAVPVAVSTGQITTFDFGAAVVLPASEEDPKDLLRRLDAIALATPRTERLSGSAEEGRVTWITRSAFWGFPDYATAQAQGDGLVIYSRLRFGRRDLGVNAARLRDWIAAL